ncbi:MAG: M10 family metallopeptidase C-terminal domain-containing protein, partial [Pseudomonadota bacterium]
FSAEVGGGAYAFVPGNGAIAGDVFYEVTETDFATPRVGDEAYLTIIHEIGHAIGLGHGHEADGISPALPAAVDSNEFSVMTYRNFIGSDPGNPSQAETFGYPQTFMTLDIAALQYMYGANYNTNAGDTTYGFNPTTGAFSINGQLVSTPGDNVVFRTIWDGNGTDTYDFSGYGNGVTVDLTPGGHSTLSADQVPQLNAAAGDQPARGSLWNALLHNNDARALIENATTGNGNDNITGNQADNQLIGGAGNDTMAGADGNDRLFGGDGDDQALGGNGDDIVFGGNGNDNLAAGTGNDQVYGGAGNDGVAAGAGNDTLGGSTGNDSLFGATGQDLVIGGADSDAVYGGADNDKVFGSAGDDTAAGGTGDDEIGAGAGNDQVAAGGGADTIYGGAGNDTLFAAAGADSVFGGAGDDQIYLGNADGARDIVLSTMTNGSDTVFGFENGTDLLNTTASGLTDFAAVQGRLGQDAAGNATIDLGNGDMLTLSGVTQAQIDASDFQFAGA